MIELGKRNTSVVLAQTENTVNEKKGMETNENET